MMTVGGWSIAGMNRLIDRDANYSLWLRFSSLKHRSDYPPLEGGSKTLLRFREGAHPRTAGVSPFPTFAPLRYANCRPSLKGRVKRRMTPSARLQAAIDI